MKKFNVLVVDDDREICEMALNMSSDMEDVMVFTATTNQEALSLIKNNFFHVACIDLLSTDGDFKMIFKILNERRPTCKCYLITGKAGDKPINLLLELLIPYCPRIEGAIDKSDINYTNMILEMADTYFKNEKIINSVKVLYNEIRKKEKTRDFENGEIVITSDEVEYLLSYIFGQRMNFTNKNSYNDIEQIITGAQLVLLSGGRSKSIVALAKAKTKEVSIEDFYTVIKISPISDTKEEINRYISYVKFMVGLSSRVELLDFVLGDTLGAVCYSFAGKPSSNIKNISDVFREKQEEQAEIYLKKLFDVNTKEWMAESNIKKEKDVLQYFKIKYKFKYDDFLKNINSMINLCSLENEKLQNILKTTYDKAKALLSGGRVRQTYYSCIVHGDMNSNNVIIDENIDPKVILIDYSDTGRGPIALDFAALECSLRLDVDTGDLSGNEYDFYLHQYGFERECTENSHNASDLPYWTKISRLLFRLYFNNFKEATKEEYLITNVLWGARVCNVKSLKHNERLRVLLWIASLLDQLII